MTVMVNGKNLGYVYGAVFGVRKGESSPVFDLEDSYVVAAAVEKAFATLTPREEKVIKMLYGLGRSGSEHSRVEVGKHFAVTRQKITEIERKALRKLRHPTRSRGLLQAIHTISDRENTEELDLSGLSLNQLPEFVLKYPNIRQLILSVNKLKILPEFISRLIHLVHISLDFNEFTDLPECLLRLSNLSSLNLAENHLTSLSGTVGDLTNLQWLSLSKNRLSKLPNKVGSLAQLKHLILYENLLTILPDSIGQLSQLETLDLSNNRLSVLPESLRNLSSLKELYLHGNQKLGLPEEILGADNLAVGHLGASPAKPSELLDYYFRIQGGSRSLNEAKLILVGRGAVGKTSIVNRLVDNTFKEERKTEGIKITDWKLRINNEDIRVNIWDFGGQEIMHATHQFFLTHRALYLLVLNGREGGEDTDAEYWLKLIESFGGNSPVIVVLNKIKDHSFDVNRRALTQKYSFIRDFIKTDCKSGFGIDELGKAIERETNKLEHLRDAFPTTWFLIKDNLARMRRNFLSFDEYRKVCTNLGEKNPHAQEALAVYLHSLGIALNYKDDPRLQGTHVLNPHWVTNGIYKILNSEKLATQKGMIRLRDLSQVLDRRKYPESMHRFLFDLMKKFELCFSFPDDDARYLIPELLDKQEPLETAEFEPEKCLNFQYHYPVLPEGLLPRFIVRTHGLSEGLSRWRTGVIMRFEGCHALVKADVQDKKTFISVSGSVPNRRRLLAVIRADFDRIHQDIRNLKPAEMVPLPRHPNLVVPYRKLLIMEQHKISKYTEVTGDKVLEFDVEELLNGVDLERTRRRRTQRDERPLKMFYSYSHKDSKLRGELVSHLKILEHRGLLDPWFDREIEAGREWEQEIKEHLEIADIVLLLVSADFISSYYCWEKEMKRALEREKNGEAKVIPIILHDCNWKNAPFGRLQALPEQGKPVSRWRPKARAWSNISEEIERAIENLRRK